MPLELRLKDQLRGVARPVQGNIHDAKAADTYASLRGIRRSHLLAEELVVFTDSSATLLR